MLMVALCTLLSASVAFAQQKSDPTGITQIGRPVSSQQAVGQRSEYRYFFDNPRPLATRLLAPAPTYEPRHFEWVMTATNLPLPPADVVNASYQGPLVGRGADGSVHVLRHTDDYSEVWYTNLRTQIGVQQWLAPVSLVSANATYASGNDRSVAVDGSGQAHFIGTNAAKSQLWYRSFDGTGLTAEIKIRQATPNAIMAYSLAVERGGMERIVWVESDQLLAVNGVGSSPSVLLPVGASGSSVSVFIDEQDNAHLLQLRTGQIRYAQAAVGQAWNPFVLLSAANSPVIADYAFGPDGSLHVLFTNNCPYGYIVITNGNVTRSEVVPFYQSANRRVRLGVISGGEPYFYVDHPNSGTDELYALSGTEWRPLTSLTWPMPLDPVPGDLLVGPDDSLTLVTESYANGSDSPGGSTLIVADSAVYRAGDVGDQTVLVDRVTALDVTNGSLTIGLPLFSTAGLGPQIPITLTYNPLTRRGATGVLPAGWRLSTEQRVWHSRVAYFGETYDPARPAINQVWLQTAGGQTIEFEDGNQPDEYLATARTAAGLKLVRNPADSTWELHEADGTTHGFADTGLIDWTADANQNLLDYQYGPSGRLEQVVDATGRATVFSYDASGLLTAILDPSGQAHQLSYYAYGESGGSPGKRALKSITRIRTDAPSEAWQFSYHAATNETAACPSPLPGTCPTKRGLLAALANPRGFATQYFYEAGGRLAKVVNADNQFMSAAYAPLAGQVNVACASLAPSSNDLLTTVTDWRGSAATYETNFEDATVWRTTDPDGQAAEQSFDTYRRLTCQKDKRGNVASYDWLPSPPSDFVRFQLENIHRPGLANPIHYTYT
ncbi:MAG: RHS repeat protein, partial [Candidatus Kerfeldbacteria bacterium]|nr:RHS repeat protein [Candidatus Kerfeldbacteria bacterium]